MNEKSTTQTTAETISQRNRSTNAPNLSQSPTAPGSRFALAQTIGNQALLELLSAGIIQAKLRMSQPGDPDEQEADHVAGKIVASTHAPKIHRKCACESSGTPCAKCQDEETTIHRSAASTGLHSSPLMIQRAPAASDSVATPDKVAGTPSKPSPTPSKTHPLVVEDDAQSVAPHQMRKSAFIGLLRSQACTAADGILKSVGHATESCPYIAKWLAFYEKQSSEHIERAILKYAPETAAARSAHQAIRLVVVRVERATLTWAKTGKISGLPDDLAAQIPSQGFFGAIQKFASSGIGGAILGFIGGRKPEKSAEESSHESKNTDGPTVSRKANSEGSAAPARDASAVRSQLRAGHSLDSRVQSQMATAFGRDFSAVRVHTDSSATKLSSDLNARAFTIGDDVAFASGEYQPGTLIGDALIAHELAHVVQQGAASHQSAMSKSADASASAGEASASHLENDADLSAVGAVASIWAGAKHGLADLRANAVPRLRSGLRLQRCSGDHDLEILGVSDSSDTDSIFFDYKSSKLDDGPQKDKIQPIQEKYPKKSPLTLYSYVSEDENSPPQKGTELANDRYNTVNEALKSGSHAHSGPQHRALDTTASFGNIEYREMRKVVVKPSGTASGVSSCAGGGEIPCSDETRFTEAQTKAGQMLAVALAALTDPLPPSTVTLLRDRFGAEGANIASVATAVRTNLTNLQSHITSQMSPTGKVGPPWVPGHRCANECEPSCKHGFVAFNAAVGSHALMTLCDNSGAGFMNQPDLDHRSQVLIHEGMHGTGLAAAPPILPVAPGRGTRDFSYRDQRLIKFLDPATALRNTDSYVLFVQQLNGMSPTIGRENEDPEVSDESFLSPAQREQVDRALAWLEGWVIWSHQEVSNTYGVVSKAMTAGQPPSGYYADAMAKIAPIFGLTPPAAVPKLSDKVALAAISDRLQKLQDVLFNTTSIQIEKLKKGATAWGKGPSFELKIGPDFFAFPAGPRLFRNQLDLLLRKMLEAHPDISSDFRPKYMLLLDQLREHFGGGSP
jgi:hypothetical protein